MKVREYKIKFLFRTSEFHDFLKEWAGAFMSLILRFFQPQETKIA